MSQTADNPDRERPGKSLPAAIALAFFLGPIGLLYASLAGGAVMLAVSVIILVPLLLGLHINAVLYFPDWVVCIVWAAFAAAGREPAATPSAGSGSPSGADGAPGRS